MKYFRYTEYVHELKVLKKPVYVENEEHSEYNEATFEEQRCSQFPSGGMY